MKMEIDNSCDEPLADLRGGGELPDCWTRRILRAGFAASMLVGAGLGVAPLFFTRFAGYHPQERRTRTEAHERARDPEQALVGDGPRDPAVPLAVTMQPAPRGRPGDS